jgi:hypothetical protein
VLAAPTGVPFVIVGGRRRSIRGYPVPFPVEDDDADRFDEGEPLRIARMLGIGGGRGEVRPQAPPSFARRVRDKLLE